MGEQQQSVRWHSAGWHKKWMASMHGHLPDWPAAVIGTWGLEQRNGCRRSEPSVVSVGTTLLAAAAESSAMQRYSVGGPTKDSKLESISGAGGLSGIRVAVCMTDQLGAKGSIHGHSNIFRLLSHERCCTMDCSRQGMQGI